MELEPLDDKPAKVSLKLRAQRLWQTLATSERLATLASLLRGNRPALTLIDIRDGRPLRADFDGRGGLLGEPARVPVECDSLVELPEALSSALNNGGRAGRRVWVLCDGLPNHLVSVPTGQVTGIGEDMLGQALLFELEQSGGQVSANQQVAHALLSQSDGLNQYWVSHAPKSLMAQLQRIARMHGSRFAGLLHPGGLPRALSADSGPNWARLEIWPDMLIGAQQRQGQFKQWAMPSNAKAQRVQSEVDRWHKALGDGVSLETLGQGIAIDILPETAAPVDLDDGDALRRWVSAWAQALAGGFPSNSPALEPPEDPRREWWLMGGSAAAALALCLLHAGIQTSRSHGLEKDLAFLKGDESHVQGIEVELGKYQKQRDELKKRLEPVLSGRVVPTPEVLAALRIRYAALLREVSANSTDGLVVEDILTKPDAVTVKGTTLDGVEANSLAAALDTKLHGLGWRVEPPRKKDLELDAGGGPWAFEIRLTDSGLGAFAVKSAVGERAK